MRTLNIKRLGIGLFCATLIGGGILTIGLNAKAITKTTLTSMKNGYIENPNIEGILEGTIEGVESSIADNLFGRKWYINLYGLVENLLGRTYIRDANPSQTVVKDNNDQLQFISFQADNTAKAEEIASLNNKLASKNIPLLYVQTPLKVIEGYTVMPPSVTDYANSNTDTFLAQLEEGGVETLDLREEVEKDDLDKSTLFYNTDHHWRTQTAFWGVEKVVNKIAEDFNIDLDPQGFYTNLNNYTETTYEQSFLGSLGRRVGKYYGGVDDYTLITPNYETEYSVTINKSDSSTTTEGSFEEAIVKNDLLEDSDLFTNRYAAYFGADYPEVIVNNELINNDTKVLILKDSFALPFSAFLSTMVEEVRMLDMRYYTDMSLEEYIDAYEPDLVLYVYKSINTQK